MNLWTDIQNSVNIARAKKDGRGPFTAVMLRAFERERCQQCDAKIPNHSFRNALVVLPSEVQYLCRGCRGVHLKNLGTYEDFGVSHFAPFIAVSIFVNLRYKDYRFSNYSAIKLLRAGSPLFNGHHEEDDFMAYGLFTSARRKNENLLREPQNVHRCGECSFGHVDGGACPECGVPWSAQWHTRMSEDEERRLLGG